VPQFLPFRGLRYTPAAGPLSELLSPPYDVITPAQQRALEQRNPRNAVLLELAGGGDERYANVASLVQQWQLAGAVDRDERPMLYVYEQQFVEEGHVFTRTALLAAVEAVVDRHTKLEITRTDGRLYVTTKSGAVLEGGIEETRLVD